MTLLFSTLKLHGLSQTRARQTVFQALFNQEPLGMAELIIRCPEIDRASVYRTVALFEQLGIVQRLQIGWKYKLELSDVFHAHHHHATCQGCSKSWVLSEDGLLESQVAALAAHINFQVRSHQLELLGYCANCYSTRIASI